MTPDERALRRFVERALGSGRPGSPPVSEIARRPVEEGGWYGAWSLDVRFADGARRRLFLKDYGTYRAPKRDMAGRRERERCVYRRLLRPELHGTARYHGSAWEPERGRYWLLLEYVDGVPVRHLELEAWCRAAAWLARFQASFRRGAAGAARPCRHLVRYDRGHLMEVADRAVAAVSSRSGSRGRRVRRLLEGHEDRVARLTAGPGTIVHGAYLPMQILAAPGEDGGRLCPLDWELAGWGPTAYDLGFLAYGFRGGEREALLDAYREEAARVGAPVPDDLSGSVACVGVHYTLAALAHSVDRGYEDEAVLEYLALLEELLATGSGSGVA